MSNPAGDDRLGRVYRVLADGNGDGGPVARIKATCQLCIDLLPVSGAGVMLMAARAHQGTIYATDSRIARLEDLQNVAAEGPCLDAYLLGRPVLEADLAGAGRRAWPVLAAGALAAGMQALFSFPLQLDAASFGALNLYREEPGGLTPGEIADARLLAAIAAREVLVMQVDAPPGSLPAMIADLSGDRSAIEQATGMVSAQMDESIIEAAGRLRTFALDKRVPLAAVAREVVSRSVRFVPDFG